MTLISLQNIQSFALNLFLYRYTLMHYLEQILTSLVSSDT